MKHGPRTLGCDPKQRGHYQSDACSNANLLTGAPLGSHSQTEEPFYDLFMLVKVIFHPHPFSLDSWTPSQWTKSANSVLSSHGSEISQGCRYNCLPDFAHVITCTQTHLLRQKYQHSSATHTPTLSSPAAITLSHHKKSSR